MGEKEQGHKSSLSRKKPPGAPGQGLDLGCPSQDAYQDQVLGLAAGTHCPHPAHSLPTWASPFSICSCRFLSPSLPGFIYLSALASLPPESLPGFFPQGVENLKLILLGTY